ncbi:MAG: hypothetical protein C0396_08230 [Anaerolinea sp.]|nr:hypothetical protein [Anaerolinea sp.]
MKFWHCLLVFCILLILGGNVQPAASYVSVDSYSWAPVPSGTANYLNNVFFINNLQGWVTGGTNTFLNTVDGGATWNPISISGVYSGDGYNSVRFIDTNTGWVSGTKVVARTRDGGANWSGFRDASSTNARAASFPVSANTIWVVGASGTNRAYWRYTFADNNDVTFNFWSPISMGIMNDLYFVSTNEGWVIGTDGVIVHITNASGTPNFSGQTSNTSQTLYGIQMLDSTHGWVVGDSGTILYTADGGDTWTPKNSGTTTRLEGVYFISALQGWVVGSSGLILTTIDGGETWQTETSGIATNLKSVFFLTDGTGFTVGQSGVILRRTSESYVYLPVIIR